MNQPHSTAAPGQALAHRRVGAGQGAGLRWLSSATLEWVSDAPGDNSEDSPPAARPRSDDRPPPPPWRALAAQAAHMPPENGLAGAPVGAQHAASWSDVELSGQPLKPLSSDSADEPIQRGGAGGDADFEVGGGLGRGRSLGAASESVDQAALGAAAAGALARARRLLGRAVRACEETSRRRGYAESLPRCHEAYTNRCALMCHFRGFLPIKRRVPPAMRRACRAATRRTPAGGAPRALMCRSWSSPPKGAAYCPQCLWCRALCAVQCRNRADPATLPSRKGCRARPGGCAAAVVDWQKWLAELRSVQDYGLEAARARGDRAAAAGAAAVKCAGGYSGHACGRDRHGGGPGHHVGCAAL